MKQIILFFFLFHIISVKSQTTFSKSYRGVSYDFAEFVQQCTDGGYILTGKSNSPGGSSYGMPLIKTDSLGNALWMKFFKGTFDNIGYSIVQTPDKGFIVLGTAFASNRQIWLLKVDSMGTTVWSKALGGTGIEEAYSINKCSDGNFIITGKTTSFGSGGEDVYLAKINPSGSLIWTKTYGGTGTDWGRWVEQTSDGGFIIVGATYNFGAVNGGIYVVKTDSLGAIKWTKVFDGAKYDRGLVVKQTSDGGYVLSGETVSFGAGDSDFFIIKTDTIGNIKWTHTFGYGTSEWSTGLCVANDGGVLATGTSTVTGLKVWAVKTDSSGNFLWEKSYGSNSYGYSSHLCSDGGFILSGYIEKASTIGDIFLVKTDINGNSKCDQSLTPSITSPSWNIYSGGNTSTGGVVANFSGTASNLSLRKLCPCIPADAGPLSLQLCKGSSVSLNASGGVSYSWSPATGLSNPNIPNPIASPTTTTTYEVTVFDSTGCSNIDFIAIYVNQLPIINISGSNSICLGSTKVLSVTGGESYSWNTGATTSSIVISPSIQTSYSVIGTDGNGCTNADTIIVRVNPIPNGKVVGPDTICKGDTVMLVASGSLFYLWNTGSIEDSLFASPTISTNYLVTITDSTGCFDIDTAFIYVASSPSLSFGTSIPAGCNFSNGSITVNASGGTPPYSYMWFAVGGTGKTVTGLASGNHTVTVSDFNSCTASLIVILGDSCDYVWPGDANDDSFADNADVLTIGIGYGKTGSVRGGASSNWIGQPCSNWTDTLANGTNYKHIDCNGDGILNSIDTNAVILNYGKSHNNKIGDFPSLASDPSLYTAMSLDTVSSGGVEVTVDIGLGTAIIPANNIYGVAFTINFSQPTLVDPSSISFKGLDSWFGTLNTDLISIGFYNSVPSSIDAAITRINQQNKSGFGAIAQLKFKTSNSLSGSQSYGTLVVSISNPMVIKNDETNISVSILSDTLVVMDDLLLSIMSHNNSQQVTVYPNPNHGEFVVSSLGSQLTEITIIDIIGNIVYQSSDISSNEVPVKITLPPKGVYFIKTSAKQGAIVVKKLVIQ